jgi:hypothetical protein
MKYGIDNNKFFIELKSVGREVGNMRQESDRRARELVETYQGNFVLSNSGGLDSQSVIHSFVTQGIPLETAFLYLPGYNDNEFEQVKILDKKYNLHTHILDLDPMSVKEEIFELSEKLDIPAKNNILQMKFLSLLPNDWNFIQMVHDPYVYVHPEYNKFEYMQGYYLPEISRTRAFENLNRKGANIFYGNTEEFLLSIIGDEIFKAALMAARYFDGNNITHPNKDLKTVDRWDFYIKPLIYGKYWEDELIYFPKFAGFENIKYLNGNHKFKQKAVFIPYTELIDFLKTPDAITRRFYQNV